MPNNNHNVLLIEIVHYKYISDNWEFSVYYWIQYRIVLIQKDQNENLSVWNEMNRNETIVHVLLWIARHDYRSGQSEVKKILFKHWTHSRIHTQPCVSISCFHRLTRSSQSFFNLYFAPNSYHFIELNQFFCYLFQFRVEPKSWDFAIFNGKLFFHHDLVLN